MSSPPLPTFTLTLVAHLTPPPKPKKLNAATIATTVVLTIAILIVLKYWFNGNPKRADRVFRRDILDSQQWDDVVTDEHAKKALRKWRGEENKAEANEAENGKRVGKGIKKEAEGAVEEQTMTGALPLKSKTPHPGEPQTPTGLYKFRTNSPTLVASPTSAAPPGFHSHLPPPRPHAPPPAASRTYNSDTYPGLLSSERDSSSVDELAARRRLSGGSSSDISHVSHGSSEYSDFALMDAQEKRRKEKERLNLGFGDLGEGSGNSVVDVGSEYAARYGRPEARSVVDDRRIPGDPY